MPCLLFTTTFFGLCLTKKKAGHSFVRQQLANLCRCVALLDGMVGQAVSKFVVIVQVRYTPRPWLPQWFINLVPAAFWLINRWDTSASLCNLYLAHSQPLLSDSYSYLLYQTPIYYIGLLFIILDSYLLSDSYLLYQTPIYHIRLLFNYYIGLLFIISDSYLIIISDSYLLYQTPI